MMFSPPSFRDSVPYSQTPETQNIDVAALRPKASYDKLIENRRYGLEPFLDSQGRVASEHLQARRCPSCASEKNEHWAEKDGMNIVQCTECKLVYVNPILHKDAIAALYKHDVYQHCMKELGEASHLYRRDRFGRERVAYLNEWTAGIPFPKRLLDVGCSTGFVLEAAEAEGWQAEGLELNPSAAAFGDKRGLRILQQDFLTSDFSAGTYAAITMFDVIEHVPSPGAFLQRALELLIPGGILFLYVPNLASLSLDILGLEKAHFIWPSHHLAYFTPQTLWEFTARNGFLPEHWETQGLDILDWIWRSRQDNKAAVELLEAHHDILQFYVNSSGHGKNLRLLARKPYAPEST